MTPVLALSLSLLVSGGTPREIASMKELEGLVDAKTWVVFDIDNTLVQPTTELGSDQWFYFLIERFEQQGVGAAEALRRANEVWNATQWIVKVEPVEAEAPAIIHRLQASGVKMMALTARDRASAPVTLSQLGQIGVSFKDSAPSGKDRLFTAKELGGGEDGEYQSGVLLVGETNEKGKSLAAFLSATGGKPTRVIFVDDKQKHAVSVLAALEARGIPCVSLRYSAADARVQRFQSVMGVAKASELARLFLVGDLSPEISAKVDAARKQTPGQR